MRKDILSIIEDDNITECVRYYFVCLVILNCLSCLFLPSNIGGNFQAPLKHANARSRSIQTCKTKGNTQRGISVKALNSKGGGKISNRELQMRLSKQLVDRKGDEPVTLQGQSFFIEGNFGYPRCRACKKQVDKYEFRGIHLIITYCPEYELLIF